MPCSEHPKFLVFVRVVGGRVCLRAVELSAFSPLPFAEEGVAVEPRPVAAASPAARFEQPRRSLRREREARELLALAKLARDARRVAQTTRDARRLHLLLTLVAAVRRAGLVP